MSSVATKPIIRPRTSSAAMGLMSLDDVTDQVSGLSLRWIVHGMSGVGKTSLGAEWEDPVFLMSPGEDGLLSLMRQGLVGKVKHFPKTCETANDAELAVSELIVKDHGHKALVVDNVGGIASLFLDRVCQEKYGGDQSKFEMFGGQGNKATLPEWRKFLGKLQRLRDAKKMEIVLLAHTRVKRFKNPEGLDYGRYYPDIPDPLDEATVNWADAVLFAQFETTVSREGLKTMATGGQDRIIQCQRSAAWEAKNRMGLPESISCDKGPKDTYQQIRKILNSRTSAVGAGPSGDDAGAK